MLPPAAVLLGWALTRVAMVAVVHWSRYPGPGAVTSDPGLYASWVTLLRSGHFPATDPSWQYPPGAAGVLVVPSFAGVGYRSAFVATMLAVDLAVLLGLLRRAPERNRTAAAWVWVAGIAAIGPVALYRFDMVPTGLAIAGMLAASPYAAGALLGLGGLVKLWPAVLILAVRERGVPVRAARAMLAVAVGLLGALGIAGRLGEALSFAVHARNRGLQIESVAATPYLLVHALAPDAGGLRIEARYGAYEVVGRYVGLSVTVTTLAGLVALAAYAVAALRSSRGGTGDKPGLAFAAVLLLLVTSKVLSPQYLIWAIGLGAVTLLGGTERHRAAVGLTLAAAAMTQVVFPGVYLSVLHGRAWAVLLLAVRNALLVAAAGLTVSRALAPSAPRHSQPNRPEAIR